MSGILSWGAYVPYWRLQRSAISTALGTAPAKGSRSVASYDEDTTSMAVEAARIALAWRPAATPGQITFSTTAPAYLDKTNATAVHAALSLDPGIPAFDFVGAVRSAMGAVQAAHRAAGAGVPTLVTLADIRSGLPGGADERDGGDGAAAFLMAPDAAADIVATAHVSKEFLDRWRPLDAEAAIQWEERFSEHAYAPLAEAAVADCLKAAGLTPSELDHVAVVGPNLRAVRRGLGAIGARPEALAGDLIGDIGNAGAAAAGIALCDILDRACPDQTILLVSLADGADAFLLRTTARLAEVQREQAASGVQTVRDQIAAGRSDLSYTTFLTWREVLRREPPRRPDPVPPAAPPALRAGEWKYSFAGSRCDECGTRHLPPTRVCVKCRSLDQMSPERLADVQATVATFTIDRLAYTLSPPVAAAVIDFDGGGRFSCELTDLDPSEVHIGLRVEMTFRNLYSANGVRNYFWKAKPVREAVRAERSN